MSLATCLDEVSESLKSPPQFLSSPINNDDVQSCDLESLLDALSFSLVKSNGSHALISITFASRLVYCRWCMVKWCHKASFKCLLEIPKVPDAS